MGLVKGLFLLFLVFCGAFYIASCKEVPYYERIWIYIVGFGIYASVYLSLGV